MMKTQLMIDLLFKIFWNFLILICTDQKFKNYEKCEKPYKRIYTYKTIRIFSIPSLRKL